MINMNIPQDLKPGDILLYSEKDIIDDLIKWKTSGTAAHVEIYAGDGNSWASRNGVGLGQSAWPFRSEGLCQVRRPVHSFNLTAATAYFETKLKGLPYGFSDIAADIGIVTTAKGVDCSHAGALLEAAGECPQFDDAYPVTTIAPRDFQIVRESVIIYSK